jgi:hypothetical protein
MMEDIHLEQEGADLTVKHEFATRTPGATRLAKQNMLLFTADPTTLCRTSTRSLSTAATSPFSLQQSWAINSNSNSSIFCYLTASGNLFEKIGDRDKSTSGANT